METKNWVRKLLIGLGIAGMLYWLPCWVFLLASHFGPRPITEQQVTAILADKLQAASVQRTTQIGRDWGCVFTAADGARHLACVGRMGEFYLGADMTHSMAANRSDYRDFIKEKQQIAAEQSSKTQRVTIEVGDIRICTIRSDQTEAKTAALVTVRTRVEMDSGERQETTEIYALDCKDHRKEYASWMQSSSYTEA